MFTTYNLPSNSIFLSWCHLSLAYPCRWQSVSWVFIHIESWKYWCFFFIQGLSYHNMLLLGF